ncbi:MAG: DUF4433 domain-containing protein [Cyclobacteriaceae bacterium]|nr:DUF4433 domain-containing protein [Cyclobacteriaceae bacterium]MCH8518099.1 DUF4433 domain-containing protein [Cyclobacteriaceae bacterium]
MSIESINLYRVTHIKNVPHILVNGITKKDSPNCNPLFESIGDQSLIDNRSTKKVWVDNGDMTNPIVQITLGDFVPFYFGVKMPMLYVVQKGGNFVPQSNSPENIIYIACSLKSIIEQEHDFYFSDGHATDNLTTFYDSSKILDLPRIIDWDAVKTAYWGGHENLNLKRKKQAEFLISTDVPYDVIVGFACYNETAKSKLVKLGIDESLVKIVPNAYF